MQDMKNIFLDCVEFLDQEFRERKKETKSFQTRFESFFDIEYLDCTLIILQRRSMEDTKNWQRKRLKQNATGKKVGYNCSTRLNGAAVLNINFKT